ncbi:MAG: hypothetical protein AAF907_12260 [Planctomycetota bacterium]
MDRSPLTPPSALFVAITLLLGGLSTPGWADDGEKTPEERNRAERALDALLATAEPLADLPEAVREETERLADAAEEAADELSEAAAESRSLSRLKRLARRLRERAKNRIEEEGRETIGTLRESIPDPGLSPDSPEEFKERAERLADASRRLFKTLPTDPALAREELRRGFDPTDVNSPLRALTRNDVLDPYVLADWATDRNRGFVAARPGVDQDGQAIPIRYSKAPVIFLNGALTNRENALTTGRQLADQLAAEVLVCHNETNGAAGDFTESLLNMADLPVGVPAALEALIAAERPVTVIAHSQGGAQLHALLKRRQRRGQSNAHVYSH